MYLTTKKKKKKKKNEVASSIKSDVKVIYEKHVLIIKKNLHQI